MSGRQDTPFRTLCAVGLGVDSIDQLDPLDSSASVLWPALEATDPTIVHTRLDAQENPFSVFKAGLANGSASLVQVVPSHDSASAVLFDGLPGTLRQAVLAAQETELRLKGHARVAWSNRTDAGESPGIGCRCVGDCVYPTAVHWVTPVHDTLKSPPDMVPAGEDSSVHENPSHPSIKGLNVSPFEIRPTASHAVADTHEMEKRPPVNPAA